MGNTKTDSVLFVNVYNFNELQSYIPNLTKYKYTAARKHALTSGAGQKIVKSTFTREGVSDHQVKHFVEFIMSPCIMTDSPYLETPLNNFLMEKFFKSPKLSSIVSEHV